MTSRSHTALSWETLLSVRFSDDRWLFFLAVILFAFFVLVIILIECEIAFAAQAIDAAAPSAASAGNNDAGAV